MKKNHGFPYKWGIKMRYVLLVLQVALFLPQWGHASNNVLLPGPKLFDERCFDERCHLGT